jgi:hypothetical protein
MKAIKTKEIMNVYKKAKRALHADRDIERKINIMIGKTVGEMAEILDMDMYEVREYMEYARRRAEYKEVTERLTAEIEKAEGRARERTIDAEDVCRAIIEVESKLNITKKAMKGVCFTYNQYAQNFPRAYKYTPMSTHFKAEFNGTEWKITDIYRDICTNKSAHIQLTDEAKQAIIESVERW